MRSIFTKKVAPNVGMPLFAQEGVSNVTAARPEGAEAHSPGQHPG